MIIDKFDTDERVFVVAEIGNNHEGDAKVAADLVRAAARAGADAVKFQTFRTEHFVSPSDAARFQRLKRFELSFEEFAELAALARSLGIRFMSTPLDLGSAAYLDGLVDAFKVASGDNDFYPLLDQIARTGKPIVVSTGASDMAQVKRTVARIETAWARANVRGSLAILHCVTSYPAPKEQANLRAIPTLASAFPKATIGYSDHTVGAEASVMAVVLGARVIEKHFTLDHHYSDFRDHQLSATPDEMKELVARIREASQMLGSGEKRLQPVEESQALLVRRSIAAARDLPAGHRIELGDLAWLRPGGGIAPGSEDMVVGRTTARAIRAGDPLKIGDFA